LEFGCKTFRSSKNKYIYLFGSSHYRSDFRNRVKRKGYLDIGIRDGIDFGRTVYIREKSKGYRKGAMIMDGQNTKCVMVIDENLPLDIIANTAAVMGVTLGKHFPDTVGTNRCI